MEVTGANGRVYRIDCPTGEPEIGVWREINGYRFRTTLHGPMVWGTCVGCGQPALERQETPYATDASTTDTRCDSCGRKHHGAWLTAYGEGRAEIYGTVTPFDPDRRDPKYGGLVAAPDWFARLADQHLPPGERPLRCRVCDGVLDPIARTAEHPDTHPTCDRGWQNLPEDVPMETPLVTAPPADMPPMNVSAPLVLAEVESGSAPDFSAPENGVIDTNEEAVIDAKGDSYADFLARKTQWDNASGFEPLWIPDFLYPFQAHLVEWAVRMGRCGLFTDCGTGKTPMQLVWAENVRRKTGKPVLIVTPLAVGYQTVAEAGKFGVEAAISRDGKVTAPITVTNYERLEKFDTDDFGGVVCDESSAIKAFDGKRRAIVTEFLRTHRYRLLGTATAAPNDYTELGTSSEALGYLGHMDMLGRFFINKKKNADTQSRWRATDRTTTGGAVFHVREPQQWRFKGHSEEGFWRWVASWARALRTPSDLGFDDNGFILPALDHRQHVVRPATPLEGTLFEVPAVGLREERAELRATLAERCEEAAKVLADADCAVAWCHLNEEGRTLTREIDGAVEVTGSMPADQKEEILNAFGAGEVRVLVTKPSIAGWGLNWQHANRMTFFPSHSYEQYYQAVRRMWRFGQPRPVTVDVITTPGGVNALANLQRKADAADRMFDQLVTYMRDAAGVRRVEVYDNEMELPPWL